MFNETFSQGLTKPMNSQLVFLNLIRKKKSKTVTMSGKQIQRNEHFSLSCFVVVVHAVLSV